MTKYSQFINFNIYLWESRKETVEEPADDEPVASEEKEKEKEEEKKPDADDDDDAEVRKMCACPQLNSNDS